ncbi:MAG: hypothetical protein JXR88_12550 [Clostridia bacterium]|nr:hypothetical protein [Clostridia bacterium]
MAYVDYGEVTQKLLGPTKGGGTFDASQTIRDLEFDGKQGKTKGMQYVDEINAVLKLVSLAITNDDLAIAMPYLKKTDDGEGNINFTCDSSSLGLIPSSAYFKNITMFAKLAGGGFKKITLYNAMNEAPFTLAAVPKSEGTVNMEIYAHWESDEIQTLDKLFEITTVPTIAA